MTEPADARAARLADAAAQTRLKKQATIASVAVAVLLIAAKLGAWLVTESVAVLSSLVDSLLDAAASARRKRSPGWARPPSSADRAPCC